MKKRLTDNEVKKMILEDHGSEAYSEKDKKLYQMLYEGLRQDPDFQLSGYFAEMVADKAGFKSEFKFNDLFMIGGLILIAALISAVALIFFNIIPEFSLQFPVSRVPGLILFSILMIVVIQFADRKLVRQRFNAG